MAKRGRSRAARGGSSRASEGSGRPFDKRRSSKGVKAPSHSMQGEPAEGSETVSDHHSHDANLPSSAGRGLSTSYSARHVNEQELATSLSKRIVDSQTPANGLDSFEKPIRRSTRSKRRSSKLSFEDNESSSSKVQSKLTTTSPLVRTPVHKREGYFLSQKEMDGDTAYDTTDAHDDLSSVARGSRTGGPLITPQSQPEVLEDKLDAPSAPKDVEITSAPDIVVGQGSKMQQGPGEKEPTAAVTPVVPVIEQEAVLSKFVKPGEDGECGTSARENILKKRTEVGGDEKFEEEGRRGEGDGDFTGGQSSGGFNDRNNDLCKTRQEHDTQAKFSQAKANSELGELPIQIPSNKRSRRHQGSDNLSGDNGERYFTGEILPGNGSGPHTEKRTESSPYHKPLPPKLSTTSRPKLGRNARQANNRKPSTQLPSAVENEVSAARIRPAEPVAVLTTRSKRDRDASFSTPARELGGSEIPKVTPGVSARSGGCYHAPVRDYTGSGMGLGNAERTTGKARALPRPLFLTEVEVGRDIEPGTSPSNAISGKDEVNGYGNDGDIVKRRRVGRCLDAGCVAMKGELKRSIEILEARSRRDERNEKNYAVLNTRLEESQRRTEIELELCEAKLQTANHELESLKVFIAKSSLEQVDVPLRKRRYAAVTKGAASDAVDQPNKRKSRSKVDLRDATWAELQALEQVENYGGLLSTLASLLFRNSSLYEFATVSLSLVEKVFLEQWRDPSLKSKVLGKYPYRKRKYVGDGPYGHVRAMPPEQVLSGWGVPLIGFDDSKNPRPTVLSSQPHSDLLVGAHTVEDAVANGTGTLTGYVDRNPFRILNVDDPHHHAFGSPEFDDVGLVTCSSHNNFGSLGSDRFIRRLIRSTLNDPALVSDKLKEQAMKTWKDSLVKKGGVDESMAEKQKRMKVLALSDCEEVTPKDVETYMQTLLRSVCSSENLARLVRKEMVAASATLRQPFVTGLLKALRLAESDPNLCVTGRIGKRMKADRVERYRCLKADDKLVSMYDTLFDEFGAGKAVEVTPGKFTHAKSFEDWGGTFGGWRMVSAENSKALQAQVGKIRVGYRDAVPNIPLSLLVSKEFYINNDFLPTELDMRKSGPFADRLFRTYEARVAMKGYLGRDCEIIYVGQHASDPVSFTLPNSKQEEYIAVKRILGDTSVRSLIEADTDWAVGIHCRKMELMHNVSVSSHAQSALYNSLIGHAGVDLLRVIREIFLEIPHARLVEVKCPFFYSEYSAWKAKRKDIGADTDIYIRSKDDIVTSSMSEARSDFDSTCKTMLTSDIHRYNFFMPAARFYSRAFYSPSDGADYLVGSAEFICLFVCSWWGVVRDANIGQIVSGDETATEYAPMSNYFKTEPVDSVGLAGEKNVAAGDKVVVSGLMCGGDSSDELESESDDDFD